MTLFNDTMFVTLWIIALVVWAGMAAATSLADLEPE